MSDDQGKSKEELVHELTALRRQILGLEKLETEHRRADQALRETNETLQSIIAASPLAIVALDLEGRVMKWSPAAERIFGWSEQEVKGRFNPIVPQGKEKEFWDDFRRVTGGDGHSSEVRRRNRDGSLMDVRIFTEPLRDAEGNIIGAVGIMDDITEHKRAERQLLESIEKYRLLADNSIDAIWRMGLDGRCTYISPSVKEMTGFTPEEVKAIPLDRYLYEEDASWVLETIHCERQKPRGERKERFLVEIRQYKKDGSLLDVEVSAGWLYNEQGEIVGLQGNTRDITARKKLEEDRRTLEQQLSQAQKLEAIGTLAGGIAHDFNNLLMGIQGYASLTLLDLEPSHSHYERMKRIEEQVKSGVDLTRQLLGLARGGRYEAKPSDMNDILAKTSSMFGRTKKEISIHHKFAERLWAVEVDRSQMEQVFMNLFVNAWQAMPGGGEICIETENRVLMEDQTIPHSLDPGGFVRIVVSDTGMGMDEKTKERIFDPFFTTKAMGRGTGLGLATVYGIVKGHGGFIEVDSILGQGTTFSICLPASGRSVVQENRVEETVTRGRETILLVDDESMVVDVTREMLLSLGYRVHAAGSGQEAVAVYMEKGREIDLVILDMIMPGMSGGETFDRLRKIDPGIRTLLSSGYSIDGQAQDILDRGCSGFLQKPFHLEQLSAKVREILG